MTPATERETVHEMRDFYAPATGVVFHIDAHKRTTAKLVASQYGGPTTNCEATTWSRKEVAVLASTDEAAEKVRDDVPDEEIVAELEVTSA